jgi:HSP20 family protein
MDMFSSLGYSESPLFAEFRRLEQQFDELFGAFTPWAGGIRSLPAGTFPAINVASNPHVAANGCHGLSTGAILVA